MAFTDIAGGLEQTLTAAAYSLDDWFNLGGATALFYDNLVSSDEAVIEPSFLNSEGLVIEEGGATHLRLIKRSRQGSATVTFDVTNSIGTYNASLVVNNLPSISCPVEGLPPGSQGAVDVGVSVCMSSPLAVAHISHSAHPHCSAIAEARPLKVRLRWRELPASSRCGGSWMRTRVPSFRRQLWLL